MKTKIMPLIILFMLLPLYSSCAVYHYYGTFMGKVIDLETKEPIEGAAVLAVYYTAGYSVGGPVYHYTNAQETLTDKNGEFRIPALNNFSFRPLANHDDRVRFTIFKPGYVPFGSHSSYYQKRILVNGSYPSNKFLPSGKKHVIQLPKLSSREERLHSLIIRPGAHTPKKKYKNLLQLINEESRKLGMDEIPIDNK